MHTASYYQVGADLKIHCLLCPQGCNLAPGSTGFCKVRRHEAGELVTANYGKVSSISLDPIEKKPLYHFCPGEPILSVGTVGCSLACQFCQNWQISREKAPCRMVNPRQLADLVLETHQTEDNIGLAYTYSEPGVWFEFLMETMPMVREYGLKNVLVTNAFLNPRPWSDLLKWTDAANIDLKGFSEGYYRKLCHGKLQPVLDNIKAAVGRIHLELTTLIIPGENDDPEQISAMAEWIAGIDSEIPLHLSRYFPNYQLSIPATSEEKMQEAAERARQYLKFVYLGNVNGPSNTVCPDCGTLLIAREGYRTRILAKGACPKCGLDLKGIIEGA